MNTGRVGIQIGATTPPGSIARVAREAEDLGYGELWMAEVYFQLGGISSVATALAATERIPVGLGVVAAAVRHPAVAAMEFASLGETYPGRFMAGLGHGVAGWLRQMGLQPSSPLGLLREATESIQQLLSGDEATSEGDYFNLDRILLHHTPTQRIPIYLGVHGAASLRLSGELANGTLLGWLSSPGYVRWARERIDEGRARAGRDDHHELVVLCVLGVSEQDPRGARADLGRWAATMLAGMTKSPVLGACEDGRELQALIEADPETRLTEGLPDHLLGRFVAAGELASCAATIDQLLAAGADRVVLVPNPAGYRATPDMIDQMRIGAALTEAPEHHD